jgi:hypothetical protein
MTEQLMAGVPVNQESIKGITYTFPVPRKPDEHVRLASGLSAAHARDGIVLLEASQERYPAQGAYFLDGQPQSPKFVVDMGNLIDPRFGPMLDRILLDEQKVETLQKIGKHLEKRGSIVNVVPHGSLLDIGLEDGLAYAALKRLGYEFRSGIMISQGVTHLGKEFKKFSDEPVPLSDALSWICHKEWLVTPRTENAQNAFGRYVADEEIDKQNRAVRADILNEQENGGLFLTVAPSATSYTKKEDGTYPLAAPNLATLRLFAHERTLVAVTFGAIHGSKRPAFGMHGELLQLSGNDDRLTAQGDELMRIMATGLNQVVRGAHFVYESAPESSDTANSRA